MIGCLHAHVTTRQNLLTLQASKSFGNAGESAFSGLVLFNEVCILRSHVPQ